MYSRKTIYASTIINLIRIGVYINPPLRELFVCYMYVRQYRYLKVSSKHGT